MSVERSNPRRPDSCNGEVLSHERAPIRYNYHSGDWGDFDGVSLGFGNASQVLAINGFADTNVDIGLQALVPSDNAAIRISLGDVLDLKAFANTGASGTVTSNAASEGMLTLTKGSLSGSYSASLSIDVVAYISAAKASIQMHITDKFQLSLSGTGYAGASIVQTSSAGGTVVAMAPSGGGGFGGGSGGTFDLARFAESVLNTDEWDIAFISSPKSGESLHLLGTSVLTISAIASVPSGHSSETLHFNEVERSSLAFNATSSPLTGACYGPSYCDSGYHLSSDRAQAS